MSLDFYKLKEEPFGNTPDARFLFMSSTHRNAFGSILRALQAGRGFVTLIAPGGLGKTTLLFHTLRTFGDRVATVYLLQAVRQPVEFLQAVLADMGAQAISDDPQELLSQLTELLTEQHRLGKRIVVVLDEAQDLDPLVLDLVKILSRLDAPRGKLVQIILCGRPELADQLASAKLAPSVQLLSPAIHLEPLSAEDTKQYVDHRLRIAGCDRETPLFTGEAASLIARFSRGVPRTINTFCTHCLSLGHKNKRERIEGDIVRAVAAELELALPSALLPQVLAKDKPVPARSQGSPAQPVAPSLQPAAVRPRSLLPQVVAVQEVVLPAIEAIPVVGRPQPVVPQITAEEAPTPRLPQAPLSLPIAALPASVPAPVQALQNPVAGWPVSIDAHPAAIVPPPLVFPNERLVMGSPECLPPPIPPKSGLPEVGEEMNPVRAKAPAAFSAEVDGSVDRPLPGAQRVGERAPNMGPAWKREAQNINAQNINAMSIADASSLAELAGVPDTAFAGSSLPSHDRPVLAVVLPTPPDSLPLLDRRKPVSVASQLLVTPVVQAKRNQDGEALASMAAAVRLTGPPSVDHEPAAAFVVHPFPRLAIAAISLLTLSGGVFAVYHATASRPAHLAGKALPATHVAMPLRQSSAAAAPGEVHSALVATPDLPGPERDLKGMDLGSALHALSGKPRSLSGICTINFGACDDKHLKEIRKVNPRLKDGD